VKIFAIVGAVVVLLAGAGAGYLFVSTAASVNAARGDSDRLLRGAGGHIRQIEATLQTPELGMTGDGTDFQAEKHQVDDYLGRLDQVQATIGADRAALSGSRGRIVGLVGNPVAVPFRQGLVDQRDRLGSAVAALDAASGGLQVERDQVRTLGAALDAISEFSRVSTAIGNHDYNGALAAMPPVRAKLTAAVQLSQGQSNPPQVHQLLVGFQKLSDDTAVFLMSAQHHDTRGQAAALNKMQADVDAMHDFDEKSFDAYEQQLIQPYKDRYEAGWKAAGFTPA
jgi:hypothetical protein